MRLALTPEERRKLIVQGSMAAAPIGRPRKSSFSDEKPVCKAKGCFNYVEHNGDALCRQCEERATR